MIFLRNRHYLPIIFLLTLTFLTGCVSSRDISGINPVYPPMPPRGMNLSYSERVDTLTPTFEWENYKKKKNVTYDFGVWRYKRGKYGDPVYYAENISGTSHKITKPLEVDTLYVWSVRPRLGSNVGTWSSYSGWTVHVAGSNSWSNLRFPFLTPKQVD